MASSLASLEAELKELQETLEPVLEGLKASPDNAELQALKEEVEPLIAEVERQIAEAKAAQPPPPTELAEKPKWSKESHPAFQPGYRRPGAPQEPVEEAPQAPVAMKVGDDIMAKWSGDKQFYAARIKSITGSSAAPVYTVKFQQYDEFATIRNPADIRQKHSSALKRKADGTPVTSANSNQAGAGPPPTPAVSTPGVISAAANINPEYAQQAKKEPSKVSDGPPKPAKAPKKIRANKELESSKSSWQSWSKNAKVGKVGKKDSMFRTGESVNARVGFTGSGQSMRKDPSRSRHVYQVDDNDGY